MFQDLAKDIKAQLYEKARSPLAFTFVAAWMVINIRIILVFFSDLTVQEKLDYFDKVNPSLREWLLHSLALPLASATAVLIVYPYLARAAFWYWQTQHLKIKQIQQKIEDKTPLTQEEAKALRKSMLEQQYQLESQLSMYSARSSELQKQLEELKNKMTDLQEEKKLLQEELQQKIETIETLEVALRSSNGNVEGQSNKGKNKKITIDGKALADEVIKNLNNENLDDESIVLFSQIVRREGRVHKGPLFQQFTGAKKVNIEHALDGLKNLGLVDGSGDGFLTLTSKGTKLAVSSGLTEALAN